MGYAEIVRPDGTVEFYGDVPLLVCQLCNEIPNQDDGVWTVSLSPLQWQCEKCHTVNGQPAQETQGLSNTGFGSPMVKAMVSSS